MEVGGACSRDFFASKKARCLASRITELDGEFGVKHMGQKELETICQNYYEKLYKARPQGVNREAECKVLKYFSNRLSPSMCESLSMEISEEELKKALFDMKRGNVRRNYL